MLSDLLSQTTISPRGWRQATFWIVLLFCGCLLPRNICAQVKPVRRVLIFYELGLSSPSVSVLDQQIRAVLEQSPFQIELYREYLETTLFPTTEAQQEIREWYIHRYRNRRPDLIMTLGPSPFRFLVSYEKSFKGIPVVFGGLSGVDLEIPYPESRFTGVLDIAQPAKTLEAALRLRPGPKHVVVVGGKDAYDLELEAVFRKSLASYESKLDITYLTDLAMPQLLERLRHVPESTIILMTHIGLDAAGTPFVGASQADPLVVNAANAPVFGVSDVDLGHGEVGGHLISFAAQGRIMGEMAIKILKGQTPQDIPVVTGSNLYMFDWRALKRWGLDERNLPAGSIVLNRQPTLWDSYKWYIVGGVCLLLAQSSLIIGLLSQRAIRRRAEGARRESERRFRLVANTAPVMIWMSRTDKMCNYFNNPWLDFTGRTLEEELGNGWTDGIHREDFAECLKTYTEAFDKRERFEMQYRLRRHDGEYRWVSDIGVPRFHHDGTFAGYIGSCIDVTERKHAEEALSTIGRRLIEAHEEERSWIGRELHDDINQKLAMVAIEMDRWSRERSRSKVSEHLSLAKKRIMEVSMDVQALSHRLHSSKLDYLGLAVAADSFCREVSEKAKVDVQFSHSAVPSPMLKEVSLCLFRVLQEALQNAIKYSGVTHFHVNLRGTSDGVELTVSDDGKGFDEHEAFSRQGLGLISMRERLQMVHGTLEIKAQPGAGTSIFARVPLQAAELQAKAG